MGIKELVNKWERLGLLENIENKPQVARMYEDTVEILLHTKLSLRNRSRLESMVFPILYRMYRDRKMYLDKIEILIMIKDLDIKMDTINEMQGYNGLDIEAEFAYNYVHNYKK